MAADAGIAEGVVTAVAGEIRIGGSRVVKTVVVGREATSGYFEVVQSRSLVASYLQEACLGIENASAQVASPLEFRSASVSGLMDLADGQVERRTAVDLGAASKAEQQRLLLLYEASVSGSMMAIDRQM